MTAPDRTPPRVGVREVRQHLSRYLDRVAAGETFDITHHGQPVARLSPLRTTTHPTLERLAAQGWVMLGAGTNLADLGLPLPGSEGPGASEILDELREDRV